VKFKTETPEAVAGGHYLINRKIGKKKSET
jgi:hypothetical protein